MQNKKLDLSDERLHEVSSSGRDFLRKTLNFDASNRLDVKGALNHPWLKLADHHNRTDSFEHNHLSVIDKLREYKRSLDLWVRRLRTIRSFEVVLM